VDDVIDQDTWPRKASYTGAAPYVETGVELLRLHRTRVCVSLRADWPLQSVERPEGYRSDLHGEKRTFIPSHSFYAVPVTLGMAVAF
jgi:hypothetical protein